MNGKLDLSKAEAISDLIHAKTELESTVALNQLQGKLYHTIQTIKHNCQQLLEHIEACIDFPEEVDPPEKEALTKSITQSIELLEPTIKHQDYGRFIHSGVKCLIIGYPNVGKSSLLNQLLGEDRAIVSDIKGTTRDFIESTIEIGGLLFELIDTAGYRDTTDEIEAIGIEKIKQLLPNCDAILWVIDQTRELNENEKELQKLLPKTIPTYLILNKSDQDMPNVTIDTISHTKALSVSAKNGDNISQINDSLYNDFSKKANDISNDLLCNMRQLSCIEQLYNRLNEMKNSVKTIQTLDMLVIDLKQAVLLCGDISGDTLTEDVLDGVFSRFLCRQINYKLETFLDRFPEGPRPFSETLTTQSVFLRLSIVFQTEPSVVVAVGNDPHDIDRCTIK